MEGSDMPALPDTQDFALIGHQESWEQTSRFVRTLRTPDKPALSIDTLRDIVPWIPARRVMHMRVGSAPDGGTVTGVYIETFITPDELGAETLRQSIGKVKDAVRCAAREGAKIAALGGFTSIVLQGREEASLAQEGPVLTTGNSLTAAFIAKGIERAAERCDVPLVDATLLIAGATGDIGMACARYFAGHTKRLLLSARRTDRLGRLATELEPTGADIHILPVIEALPQADVVISAASLQRPEWDLAHCQPEAIVCDAGYPKNLRAEPGAELPVRVFHGGMGQVAGGWTSDSAMLENIYRYPAPFISHGCLLEAIVLAMEQRYEPFSRGRGHITPARLEEIWRMAAKHGIRLAPFFNHDGLWAEQPAETTSP